MNELLKRITAIEDIMNQPLSNKAILAQSLQQFSGLVLSDLSANVKKKIECELVEVNHILSQYDINTVDDFRKINKKDLKKLIMIIRGLCQGLSKMVTTELI